MRKILPALMLLTALILLSCEKNTPSGTPSSPALTESPTQALPSATPSPAPTLTPTPTPERNASISEVENEVLAKTTADEDFSPAKVDEILFPGGEVQSGETGRATLELLPEETIVRVAPNSSFTLEELSPKKESPFTKLKLVAGQIWILLSGGELQTETPYGIASVHGSMMSVSFNENTLSVTCLEGHCSVENNAGNLEMVAGQAVDITGLDSLPNAPRPMTLDELRTWLEANPEAQDMVEEFLSLYVTPTLPPSTLIPTTIPTIPPDISPTPPPTFTSTPSD